jgi:hypothetical protein
MKYQLFVKLRCTSLLECEEGSHGGILEATFQVQEYANSYPKEGEVIELPGAMEPVVQYVQWVRIKNSSGKFVREPHVFTEILTVEFQEIWEWEGNHLRGEPEDHSPEVRHELLTNYFQKYYRSILVDDGFDHIKYDPGVPGYK